MANDDKEKYIVWYKDGAVSVGKLVEKLAWNDFRVDDPCFMYQEMVPTVDKNGKETTTLRINFMPYAFKLAMKDKRSPWRITADAICLSTLCDQAMANYFAAINLKAKEA